MTMTNDRINHILAAAVGIAAFVLLMSWPFEGIHPESWSAVATSAGLNAPATMLPGLGGYLAHLCFCLLPFDVAVAAVVLVGKVTIAVCGCLAYHVFSGLMEISSGMGARDWPRRRLAIRVAATTASFLLVCAQPVWTAAQAMTGTTAVFALIVLTLYFWVRLLQTARPLHSVLALMTAGLLSAETPLGWVVLGVAVWATFRYLAGAKTPAWLAFLDPVRMQRTKWSMTFVFLGSFVVGAFLDIMAFVALDGNLANGITAGEMPIAYLRFYWAALSGATGVVGFCSFLLVALVPFVIAMLMVTQATDEDHYLTFRHSIVYLMAGGVAYLQLSPFSFGWFWTFADEGGVVSRQLIVFSSLLSAFVVGAGLYVLCVEIFCRNYEHIESVLYQNYVEEDGDQPRPGHDNVVSVRLTVARLCVLLVPLALLVVGGCGCRQADDRALCAMIRAFVIETIEEAVGVRYLFTDGAYDAPIQLEARRRGIPIKTVALTSGADLRDVFIRQQGVDGVEDRMTLEAGAAEALRTWVQTKSERLKDVAVQLAFEIFRLNRHLKPLVYGAMVRPVGGDERNAEESVTRAHRLADEIVALHENGTWRHAKSDFIKDRFLFAQFRLAVMSRLRAIRLDSAKKVKESLDEIAYADRLNQNNPSLTKILRRMDWVKRQSGEALTPREGLEVALKRADFNMARRYAMPVLREDADEPNANFAVGMSYYAEEQFAKAETYLRRVLKRNPNEPAVYNNLALVQLKTMRFEEAETNALQALELMPQSPEIKDTLRQIREAKEEARGFGARKAKGAKSGR